MNKRALRTISGAPFRMGSLPRFLEFWDETGAEEKVPLPESADAVRILTIHKSDRKSVV